MDILGREPEGLGPSTDKLQVLGGCMRLRIKWPAATFPRAAARTTGTGQMPFWSGVHAAVDGPFTILRFAERDTPDLVYFEQLTCVLYLDKNEASSITSW